SLVMSVAIANSAPSRRTASKETRRQQLIQATIRSIAKYGLSDTTVATVAREAKLSQGIVNLHFQSKQGLLIETLKSVADEYKDAWEKALANAGPSNAEQLEALVNVDFCPAVCDRTKIAVWFAYWSETKSRPTYRKLCAERDRGYDRILNELLKALIAEGNYKSMDADAITDGLSAMSAGLWLDLLVDPRGMSRERARKSCRMFLSQLFPKHFKPQLD
ncbi:MAG TPA: transcriptional regulator BetI, partial [Xanthomonadales bacterium]|nr:transcriptional regulator BetI [Xanthomonadales bacterium]